MASVRRSAQHGWGLQSTFWKDHSFSRQFSERNSPDGSSKAGSLQSVYKLPRGYLEESSLSCSAKAAGWREMPLCFPAAKDCAQAVPRAAPTPVQWPWWQILTHFQLCLHALFSLVHFNKFQARFQCLFQAQEVFLG